jgi:hypothetical protein
VFESRALGGGYLDLKERKQQEAEKICIRRSDSKVGVHIQALGGARDVCHVTA